MLGESSFEREKEKNNSPRGTLGSTEVMKAKRARFPTIFHATVATRIVVHAHTCALQIVVQDLRASQVWQEIVLFSRQNINCANTKKKTAKFPSKHHKTPQTIITQPHKGSHLY